MCYLASFLYVITILPADLEVLFICWSSPVRKMILDIGVSNRRSLGFVQIWQEGGGEGGGGEGEGEFEGWSGAYLQEKDYRPKSISAICYSSTQPEYLNLLVCSLLMTSAGKQSWNCRAQMIFCWVQYVSTVNNRIIVTVDNSKNIFILTMKTEKDILSIENAFLAASGSIFLFTNINQRSHQSWTKKIKIIAIIIFVLLSIIFSYEDLDSSLVYMSTSSQRFSIHSTRSLWPDPSLWLWALHIINIIIIKPMLWMIFVTLRYRYQSHFESKT